MVLLVLFALAWVLLRVMAMPNNRRAEGVGRRGGWGWEREGRWGEGERGDTLQTTRMTPQSERGIRKTFPDAGNFVSGLPKTLFPFTWTVSAYTAPRVRGYTNLAIVNLLFIS